MIEVLRAAAEVQKLCDENRWEFCFIGGVALLRWGEPRETVDVDVTLLTGLGEEKSYIDTLCKQFETRRTDALEFALRYRVLLLRARSGVGIDVALAWIPFEERAVGRAKMYNFSTDIALRTCSAEDLIVMKAFADRGKDWIDVENIIIRQSAKLDWDYILREMKVLTDAKDAPEILTELQNRRKAIEGS